MSYLAIAYAIHREYDGEHSGADQVSGAPELSLGSWKAGDYNANGRYLLAKDPCFLVYR